jgi:hypothetical protein
VTEKKHHSEEAGHTLPFTLTETQLSMAHKERFSDELVSSVLKEYTMLSKDKLECELSADSVREDPPCLEGGTGRGHNGAAASEDLSVHCRDH